MNVTKTPTVAKTTTAVLILELRADFSSSHTQYIAVSVPMIRRYATARQIAHTMPIISAARLGFVRVPLFVPFAPEMFKSVENIC